MPISSSNVVQIFLTALALSSPQINALPIEDCIGEYFKYATCPPESCTQADVQAAMSVYFKKECPKPGPRKDGSTPACCFITPPLVRITADEAFNAFQSQSIDDKEVVLMIDVRTPDEVSPNMKALVDLSIVLTMLYQSLSFIGLAKQLKSTKSYSTATKKPSSRTTSRQH